LGKMTIRQTSRGAVGCVTTAQSMTIEEQIVEEKRHRTRQKPGIIVQGKRAPGRTGNG
ncbi:hypothetical protein T11_17396, partial [Trichinella zimbabwensis]